MRLARLLADPWTAGAGVFVGALATAGLQLPLAVGLGAAAASYAVGTAVKALTHDRGSTPVERPRAVELPPRGSSARVLYDRAVTAVDELGELARAQPPGPLRARAQEVAASARSALEGVAGIAAQTVVLERALERVDVRQATQDLRRLESTAPSGPAHASSLAAVRSQLAVASRLDGARREAHDRLLSAVLGLESLVASTAEVLAVAATTADGDAGARIAALSEGLTALRQGLAEAEATSRQALSG